ncbi:bifunctional DNA primase/polymerase [Magnetococcales bacterium HHB-1]
MSKEPNKLDHALSLASMGFRVFPLEANGKRPLIDGWQRKASQDPERIRGWWVCIVTGWVQDYNIGITGGLFVDIDQKNGVNGQQSLESLIAQHGSLPLTRRVRTPSGGEHIYFHGNEAIRSSAGKLGPGLDIRSQGGYVVAPGSSIHGQAYTWIDEQHDVAPCPEWLINQLQQVSGIDEKAVSVELDTSVALERATHFLNKEAPLAIEGSGGDATTYRVAALVKDYGVSEARCLDLMISLWNERCSPPWSPEELSTKVTNAYRYGAASVGIASPEADFSPVQAADDLLAPQWIEPFEPISLPPREWVLGSLLLKKNVSVLVAPPSAGKSTLTLLAAVAIVAGRGDLIGMELHCRERVWLYNNEDDVEEMKRRLSAILNHFKLTWKDLEIEGRIGLAINSGENRPLTVARRSVDGKRLLPADARPVAEFIHKNQIGVLIVDPFLESHEASENSNEEISRVSRIFRAIAKKTNSAVMLVHHSRKAQQGSSEGHTGNMDSARGASALMGVARIANTLYTMSPKDAKQMAISEKDRYRYVRLDDAKANMTLMSHKPKWFKKVSVKLPNQHSKENLSFDEVGVLEPVNLSSIEVTEELLAERQSEELAYDVIAVMEKDEDSVAAFTLVKRLIERNPMYRDKQAQTLTNDVINVFRDRRHFNGYGYQFMQLKKGRNRRVIQQIKEDILEAE